MPTDAYLRPNAWVRQGPGAKGRPCRRKCFWIHASSSRRESSVSEQTLGSGRIIGYPDGTSFCPFRSLVWDVSAMTHSELWLIISLTDTRCDGGHS
jgi:hypothetical protein